MATKNLGRVVGKDGKSAYQIWLEQGNNGTEQEFLDSLKAGGTSGGDNDIIVSDNDISAFDISDEEDNVVLRISNAGHIQTKLFNSAEIKQIKKIGNNLTLDKNGQLSASNISSGNDKLNQMYYEIMRQTGKLMTGPFCDLKANVCVIGDSTIAGTGVGTRLSALLGVNSGYTLWDISTGGDTAQGQLSKWNAGNSSVKTSLNYVIIQIGLNDVNNSYLPVSGIQTNIQNIVDKVRQESPNATIILSTMTPARERWENLHPGQGETYHQKWKDVNKTITDNVYGADRIADIHTELLGYNDYTLRPEYESDLNDHIHENLEGQKLIALSWLSTMVQN